MLTRKCDICGSEMRVTSPRYTVTFDGWLYKETKDICVACFERIKSEIKQADTPQTEQTEPTTEDSSMVVTVKPYKPTNKEILDALEKSDCPWK